MTVLSFELVNYVRPAGNIPLEGWLAGIEMQTRVKIRSRINRLRHGNFSNCDPVGQGLSELKINYGPGFRVYFGRKDAKVILLLCGGDKSSQVADIRKAHELWQEYQTRAKEAKKKC